MYDVTSPTVDTLMRLADELEAAAFRWGSLTQDMTTSQDTWNEAHELVKARRTALRRALAQVWSHAGGIDHRTPVVDIITHLDCELDGTDVEWLDYCPVHKLYVSRHAIQLPNV
jgi:hypothetical protein